MNLFGKDTRPVFNADMKKQLAEAVGDLVHKWCNGETSLEDCIASAEKVLSNNHNEDGYYLAKEFEDEGFDSDAQLVDELNSIWHLKSDILTTAVKKWVKEDKIEPEFTEGTVCMVKYGGKTVEGTITGFHRETAQYLVCIPSEGMLESKTRAVINYEMATLK